jgi:ATP-dependent Clp protease ATP-binding subunit ClpX
VGEKDILDFGVYPEILGRIGSYVVLHDLSEDDLYKILIEVENSVVERYKKLYEMRGLKWTLKKADYKRIIGKIKGTQLGARSIKKIMLDELLEEMFNSPA